MTMIYGPLETAGDFSTLSLPRSPARDVVTWTDGGTIVVRFTADTASADVVGDVQVFGPVYIYSDGLKAKDDTNTATIETSWEEDEVVTVVIKTNDDEMSISADGITFSDVVNFDGTLPLLALSSFALGRLRSVQTWRKSDVSKREIDSVLRAIGDYIAPPQPPAPCLTQAAVY